MAGAPLDHAALAKALAESRKANALDPNGPIDVLVTQELDAQRLVDVLVALELAGVRVIGLGTAPATGSEEAALRGRAIPRLRIGWPKLQGDVQPKTVRQAVAAQRPALLACYTQALAKKPGLAGTVQLSFFVGAKGDVAASESTGVDPDLGACFAGVVRKAKLPGRYRAGIQAIVPIGVWP